MEHHAPSPDIPLSEGGELAADVELIDPHRRSEEELAKISRHIQALSADDTHVLLRRLLEWISSAESQEDTDLLPAEIPDEIDLPHVEAEAPEDPSPSATVSVVLPPAPGATERVLPARTAITRRRRVVPTTRTVDVATPAPPPVPRITPSTPRRIGPPAPAPAPRPAPAPAPDRQEEEGRLERVRQEREKQERERLERERLERERLERERLERERLERERQEQERLLEERIREIEARQERETQEAADVLADRIDGVIVRQKTLLRTGLADREHGMLANVAKMKFFLHQSLTAEEGATISDSDRTQQPAWLGSLLLFEPGGVNSGARATLAADQRFLADVREVQRELDAFVPARMPRRARGEPLETYRLRLEAAQREQSERMQEIVRRLGDKAPNYNEANKILQDAYDGAPKAAENTAKLAGDTLMPPVGGIISGCAWRCSWQLARSGTLDQAFIETEARAIAVDVVAALIGVKLGKAAAPTIRWMAQRFPPSIRRAMGEALEAAFDRLADPAKEACAEFIVDLVGTLKA